MLELMAALPPSACTADVERLLQERLARARAAADAHGGDPQLDATARFVARVSDEGVGDALLKRAQLRVGLVLRPAGGVTIDQVNHFDAPVAQPTDGGRCVVRDPPKGALGALHVEVDSEAEEDPPVVPVKRRVACE